MTIRVNSDEEIVKMIRDGLKAKNGYCPCMVEENEDTKCMCKQFRERWKRELVIVDFI